MLKTADGERVAMPVGSIEDRRISDVSLMPDGLAQTLTDGELVDLLAFLTTLQQPVASSASTTSSARSPSRRRHRGSTRPRSVDLEAAVDDGQGRKLSWRRVTANAEGLVDLAPLAGGDSKTEAAAYLYAPLVSPVAQKARLVLDTPAEATAWVNGKPVALASSVRGREGRPAGRGARRCPRGPGRS